MTTISLNRPTALADSATTWNDVSIVTCFNPNTTPNPNTGNLVINDAASLATANSGNALLTIPFATLFQLAGRGPIEGSGSTSNGLVVSAIPPGVAIIVDFGS